MGELRNKKLVAAKEAWGLEEKKFGEDSGRRGIIFNKLVKIVMAYGAEI